MRRPLALLLLALAIVAASPAAALAADRYAAVGGDDVANTGALASPFASVQKAIDSAAASGGGNVYVGPGTFSGNVTLKNGVSLYGAGASETTLTVTSGRVVTISGIGAGETVAGFAITGGSAVSGAGIYCTDSSPVIRDNVIVGNTVVGIDWDDMPQGGGIYCYRGAPTITNNVITGNAVSGDYAQGGGIATSYSTVVISGNTVAGNTVNGGSYDRGCGGGISCTGGTSTVTGNAVSGNTVFGDYAEGGGIAVESASSQVTGNAVHNNLVEGGAWGSGTGGGIYFSRSSGAVTRNSVSDNIARGEYAEGGGIAFDAGWGYYTPTISANVVTGNTADGTGSRGMGGGISVSDGSPRVLGNIISGNTALGEYGGEGGGLFCSSFWEDYVSTPIITNNVITANLAGGVDGGAGGGAYFGSSPAVVTNNTVAGNRAEGDTPGAGGVSVEDFWGRGRPTIRNCIIWGNTGAEISGVGITYSCVEGGAAGAGNISSDPLFFDPAAEQYDLTAGSPASEVASPTVAPADDIRGVARPQGAGYDMGAYELAPAIVIADPVAVADAYTATEDVLLAVMGRGVLANDTVAIDRGPLVAAVVTEPTNGTLVFAADGSFTYAPDANWSGTDTFEYTVTDTSGAEDTATVTITVQSVPDPPVLGTLIDSSVDELSELRFMATATDIDTPAGLLGFSLGAGAPAGASIDGATGEFTWTPSEAQGPGSFPVTVIVSDGTHTDSATITITVNDVNVAPVLGAIGSTSVNELVLCTFTASATDADLPANTLAFSLGAGAPAGAAIDSVTGAFSWTPTEAQSGAHAVDVVVSDGSLTATETITITVAEVNLAPELGAIGNRSVDEGSELAFTATATDVDLPANTLTFSLGAGAPAGATIDPATGAFAWTPTEAQGPGEYPITITVSDGALSDSETFTVTVAEVATAPVLGAIGARSVSEGVELAFTATATDADLPANTLTFSLGAGAPAGATIDPATGAFNWTPTEAQGPGAFDVTVTVSDGALTASETFTVTVAEAGIIPVLGAIGSYGGDESTEITFTATATDADLPANTLTFSLGAGAPAGASINPVTGVFSWTPTEAQSGTHTIEVVVSDGTLTDSETITVTVAEVNVAPVLGGIGSKSANELAPFTFTATATDADLPANTLTFSLGAGAPAGAAINAATGVFTWTPTEAQGPGSYTITVTVSDGTLTDSEAITLTVAEVAEAKSVTVGVASAPAADPAASETATTGSDPVAPGTTAPTAGEADDAGDGDGEGDADEPPSDTPADEPDGDESDFPWWAAGLVFALGGLGLFGAVARRGNRDAGVDTPEG